MLRDWLDTSLCEYYIDMCVKVNISVLDLGISSYL